MEIKFRPRMSGKTTEIRDKILKEMEKDEYSIACISVNSLRSGVMKDILGVSPFYRPKKYRNPSHSITFSTYKRMHMDLNGEHPRNIFFDDVRMRDVIKVLPQLHAFYDAKVTMLGSVEDLIKDFKELFVEIGDLKFQIDLRDRDIKVLEDQRVQLNNHIQNLIMQNHNYYNSLTKASGMAQEYFHKLMQSDSYIDYLRKKIWKMKRSKGLRKWWDKKWGKFQII